MGAVMKLRLENHGSIWLARPLDSAAVDWLNETAPDDASFFSMALAIEPRYVDGFLDAAIEAGAEFD
jgi:hypothetical protein